MQESQICRLALSLPRGANPGKVIPQAISLWHLPFQLYVRARTNAQKHAGGLCRMTAKMGADVAVCPRPVGVVM